jgi:hypothetical protein
MDDLDPLSSKEISSILPIEQDGRNCSEWVCPGTSDNYDTKANSPKSVDSNESDSDDVDPVVFNEIALNAVDNEYIRGILRSADLHILQPSQVSAAYDKAEKEVELFHLFKTKNYLETVSRWTNEILVKKGRKPVYVKEFFSYVSLELGMSLLKFNDIKK